MTPSAEKKAWCSPKVERFGSFAEMTLESGQKDPGLFDSASLQDNCPPGQFPCDGVS